MCSVHVCVCMCLCVRVCVFGRGVDAGEDESEIKISAIYMCSLYFTAHYLVTLTVCLPSILYVVSRV